MSCYIEPMDREAADSVRALIRDQVDQVISGKEFVVAEKAPHDLVTEYDSLIGTRLATSLTSFLPGSTAWTEDGEPGRGAPNGRTACRWVIDPIDGTANLVMGNTHYCTSVALECDGKLSAGFVYHAPLGRTYWTIGDGRSYLDDTPIRPSDRGDLASAYVVFGFSTNLPNIERYRQEWTPAFENARKSIGLLAPALNICTVATGAVDAFVDFGASMEGQAAAGLILLNAGGTVTNYDGSSWDHRTTGVYAGNGRLPRGRGGA